MEFLKSFLQDTKSIDGGNFVCRYTDFSSDELLSKLSQEGLSFSRRSSRDHKKGKYHFSSKDLRCNYQPFLKLKYITYQCCNGPLYYKTKKDKNEVQQNAAEKTRFYIQPSKKMECPAVMTISEVKYAISEKYQINKNDLDDWRVKKKIIDKLKEDMKNPQEKVEFQNRLFILISTKHNHDVTSTFLNQSLDINLKEQINSCVLKGIHDVAAIRNILQEYVAERFPNIPSTSKAFHPEDRTIYNHILKFSYQNKRSKIDQQALQLKVEEWRKDTSKQIFYRPYAQNEDGSVDSFIFCFLEKWQQDLLKKYGSLSFLDATYKTVKYNLPLFLLVIKSNVSYIPVGIFIIQNKTAESIEEALKIFQSWNHDWQPTYFLTDFSDSEIKAIKSTFECKNLICSFHREQAWSRWLKKKENSTDADAILAIWRKIAKCQDVVELEDLKTSAQNICKRNRKAWAYFDSTWLPHIEKWCDAYFEPDCYMKIRTNNGVENMNRNLKHAYLKRYTDESVTGLMIIIIGKFLPDQLSRYVKANSRLTQGYKLYNADIPQFLHNRPAYFIKHVYRRYVTATKMCDEDVGNTKIVELQQNSFLVKSENDEKLYTVNFGDPSCDCIDFNKYLLPCKHLCSIFITQPNHSFDNLPEEYKNSPFFILDEKYNTFEFCSKPQDQSSTPNEPGDLINYVEGGIEAFHDQNKITESNQSKILTEMKIQCKTLLDTVYTVDKSKIDETFESFNFVARLNSLTDDLKNFVAYDERSNLPLVPTDDRNKAKKRKRNTEKTEKLPFLNDKKKF